MNHLPWLLSSRMGEIMKKKKIIIIGIIVLVLIIAILCTVLLLKKEKNVELVYLSNGRLYLYNKKESKQLGRGELASVVYSPKDHSIFLYKVENDLYIHNKEEQKIIENAKSYYFANDKVIVLDINNKLSIYDQELKEIEEKINSIIGVTDDNVLYTKDTSLISYNVNDDKKETVASNVFTAYLTQDKKSVIFSKKQTLIKYNIENKKEEELINNNTMYYCDDSCNHLYYLDKDNELYYYDGKESKEIDKGVSIVIKYDFNNDYIIYSKKANELFIYSSKKKEAKELKDISSPREILNLNNILYYQTFEGIIYKIDKDKLELEKLSDDLYDNIQIMQGKLLYHKFEEGKNDLYLEDKKIVEDIIPSFTRIDDKNNTIYYVKKEDNENSLYKYENEKETLIDKNIYKYYLLDNKEVYYIKDYKQTKAYGDLYKYHKEPEKVIEQVTDVIGFENLIENK